MLRRISKRLVSYRSFQILCLSVHQKSTDYLAIKKKEILPFATVWMDLDSIMLSEISPSEKDKYHMIHLYVEPNEQTELTRKIETHS